MGVQVKIIRFNTIRSSGRNHEIHKPSIYIHLSGWWLSPTPLKNGVQVSCGDEIPNCFWKVMFQSPPSSYSMGLYNPIQIHQIHQPSMVISIYQALQTSHCEAPVR